MEVLYRPGENDRLQLPLISMANAVLATPFISMANAMLATSAKEEKSLLISFTSILQTSSDLNNYNNDTIIMNKTKERKLL